MNKPRALAIALAGTAVIAGALAVRGRGPVLFDLPLTRLIQRQSWGDDLLRGASWLGDAIPLLTMGVIAAIVLRRTSWVRPLVAFATAEMVVLALRLLSERPRPAASLVAVLAAAPGTSFPSGHAASSAAMVTLIVLGNGDTRAAGIGWLLLAVIVVSGIGISRVYLGVHWPTDVAAGWVVGVGVGAGIARFRRRVAP